MLLDLGRPVPTPARVALRPMTADGVRRLPRTARHGVRAGHARRRRLRRPAPRPPSASEQSPAELLPRGVDTPGHRLWSAYDGDDAGRDPLDRRRRAEGLHLRHRGPRRAAPARVRAGDPRRRRRGGHRARRDGRSASTCSGQRRRPRALRARGLRHTTERHATAHRARPASSYAGSVSTTRSPSGRRAGRRPPGPVAEQHQDRRQHHQPDQGRVDAGSRPTGRRPSSSSPSCSASRRSRTPRPSPRPRW